MVKVRCDNCGKKFIPMLESEAKFLEKEQVSKTYFKCPYCGYEYSITYDNDTTYSLQKKINKLKAELSGIKNESVYMRKMKVIRNNLKRLEEQKRKAEELYKSI